MSATGALAATSEAGKAVETRVTAVASWAWGKNTEFARVTVAPLGVRPLPEPIT